MHRPACREAREPLLEARSIGEGVRVQFGITAGQPAAIAILGRALIGKRRKGHDFRAGAPPPRKKMRVGESEGSILRQCYALARRGKRRDPIRRNIKGRRKVEDQR